MKYVGLALLAFLALFILYCLLIVLSTAFADGETDCKKSSRYYRFLLNSSTKVGMIILRVKLHVSGMDNVPKDSRFLLVGNHISNYDPIVTWLVLKDRDLAFISKPENFKVPFWGTMIRKCGFMGIDRENPKNAVRTINLAAEKLKADNVSVGVYPEGTRCRQPEMLPFHTGVFRIAQKADVPIVVAAVRGTELIHKNYIRRRTHVYVDFVDVIPKEEVHKMTTAELSDRARRSLESVLKQNDIQQENVDEKVLRNF